LNFDELVQQHQTSIPRGIISIFISIRTRSQHKLP
jgi:hypothetical protein